MRVKLTTLRSLHACLASPHALSKWLRAFHSVLNPFEEIEQHRRDSMAAVAARRRSSSAGSHDTLMSSPDRTGALPASVGVGAGGGAVQGGSPVHATSSPPRRPSLKAGKPPRMHGLSGGSRVTDGAPNVSPTHGTRAAGIAGDAMDTDSPTGSGGLASPRRRTARLRGRRPSMKDVTVPAAALTRGVAGLPSDSDSDGDVGRGGMMYASSSESEAETEATPFGGWRGAMHMLSGVTLSLKKRGYRRVCGLWGLASPGACSFLTCAVLSVLTAGVDGHRGRWKCQGGGC